jgi:hypothetical protein
VGEEGGEAVSDTAEAKQDTETLLFTVSKVEKKFGPRENNMTDKDAFPCC